MDYAITFQGVSHAYQIGTNQEVMALKDINLNIEAHHFNAIVGHTGSGKSTLVKHINGLLKPSKGTVTIDDLSITNKSKEKDLKVLRQKVGIVFQFPEKQLFGETVKQDISFGPHNFFTKPRKIEALTMQAFRDVGLPNDVLDSSPFDLSGGQQRRVAIAGVLACQPQILILDEPTVGLDEEGKQNILQLIDKLYHRHHLTVILITHQMDVVSSYADTVIAINNGEIAAKTTPRRFFSNLELVKLAGVDLPDTVKLSKQLMERGIKLNRLPLTPQELVAILKQKLGE